MKTIGIDIGGSKIAMGVVEGGEILHHISLENIFFNQPDKMVKALVFQIKQFQQMYRDIASIGIGSPGWVIDGVIYEAVNLGITEYPLRNSIVRQCSLPIVTENDARTALLAELNFGALKNCVNGAMITFGTGIGGGLIIDRKLFYGSFGYAGEIGHLTLAEMGNNPCPCGKSGCFELYASVSALIRMANDNGLSIDSGREFFTLAQAKNLSALAVLNDFTKNAAKGIIELAMLMDLDTIAIGGGISEQTELFINPIKEKVKGFAPNCKILQAELGNSAGVIGASLLK